MSLRDWDWKAALQRQQRPASKRNGAVPAEPEAAAPIEAIEPEAPTCASIVAELGAGLEPSASHSSVGPAPAIEVEVSEVVAFLRAARDEAVGILEQLRRVLADARPTQQTPTPQAAWEGEDVAEARARIERLSGEMAEVDRQRLEALRERDEALGRVRDQRTAIAGFETAVSDYRATIASYETEAQQSKAFVEQTAGERDQALTKLEEVIRERDEALAAATPLPPGGDALQAEIDRLKRALSSAEARLQTAVEERDRARQEAKESKRVAEKTGETAGPGLQRVVLDLEMRLWDFLFMRARRSGCSVQQAIVKILDATHRMAGGKP